MILGYALDKDGHAYDVCLFERDYEDNRKQLAYVLVTFNADTKRPAPTANGFVAADDIETVAAKFPFIVWTARLADE